ncbi:MAG: hypothetical protein QM765_41285 [Myxococcales bacterium]
MGEPSAYSVAFHEAFQREFWPLLARLGFERGRPKGVKPAHAVDLAQRALGAERRLEVTAWCATGPGAGTSLRVDLVYPTQGVEVRDAVALMLPWRDPSLPSQHSLASALGELHAHESETMLGRAVAFMAGCFAANGPRLAAAAPELGAELANAAQEPAWQGAIVRARGFWASRHVRGEIDETIVPARLCATDPGAVAVEADAERFEFRIAPDPLDPAAGVAVARRCLTPLGRRAALRLINGSQSWDFDTRGDAVRLF